MGYAPRFKDRRLQRIITVLLDPSKKHFLEEPALRLFQMRHWLCGPSSMNVSFDRAGAYFGAAHFQSVCPRKKGMTFSKSVKTYLYKADNYKLFNEIFAKKDFFTLLKIDESYFHSQADAYNEKVIASICFVVEVNAYLRSHRKIYLEDDAKQFILDHHKRFGSFSYTKTRELLITAGDKALLCAAAQRVCPDLFLKESLDIDENMRALSSSHYTNEVSSFFSMCLGLLQLLGERGASRELKKLTGLESSKVDPLNLLPQGETPSFKHD